VKDAAPSDVDVAVTLASDPAVSTVGRVREVSPQADPVTRTFQVRVGLADPPAAMRLGSTVTGTVTLGGASGIMIPATALTARDGSPAVWVVDPVERTVSLRNVDVARYELDRVLLAQGLDEGELVVTAGVQALRPGQRVRLPGDPAETLAAAAPEAEAATGGDAEAEAPAASDTASDTESVPASDDGAAR
jgi:RND family efflux transporter MFP subunit